MEIITDKITLSPAYFGLKYGRSGSARRMLSTQDHVVLAVNRSEIILYGNIVLEIY